MSVQYRPVQWNRFKIVYDAAIALGVAAYIIMFLRFAPDWAHMTRPITGSQQMMRAFGSCGFIMLTIILCIGPLARLDRRFLPLLYNRRHLGVTMFVVSMVHVMAVIDWYDAFSPIKKYVAALISNTTVTSWLAFPFEYLGMAALLILFVMAATSHDFWLAFFGAPLWKALHMGVYLAYGLLVMHVVMGIVQSEVSPFYPAMVGISLTLVIGLHLAAGLVEARRDRTSSATAAGDGWLVAAPVSAIPPERGITLTLNDGERIAVFRHGNRISALANACAHQNGPLGEGRVIDGCVTCPWHGFQYRPEDGCSPPPFTEKVATYQVRLDGNRVLVNAKALPPGTYTPPIELPDGM